jgi:hypothetical protein
MEALASVEANRNNHEAEAHNKPPCKDRMEGVHKLHVPYIHHNIQEVVEVHTHHYSDKLGASLGVELDSSIHRIELAVRAAARNQNSADIGC